MKKSNLTFIIILFSLIILSCLLGSIQMLKKFEGFEDKDEAPPCYSTIHDEYAPFNSEDDDNYILKTKIVPPKGTSCPKDISTAASDYLNGKSVTEIKASSNSSNSTSTVSNTYNSVSGNSGNSGNQENAPKTQIQSGSEGQSISQSETHIQTINEQSPTNAPVANDTNPQYTTYTSNEVKQDKGNEKNEKNEKTNGSSQCPPCPACERCPEPAFECKKVPNYRSPSVNQYLPMPILNDFSKF